MAGPRKRDSSRESVGEIFSTLDDLSENVESSSIVDYSQSLSDMFASNEQFLREELHTLPFTAEEDEALRFSFDSNLEEISDEQPAGNGAAREINEGGSSKIKIEKESGQEILRGLETIDTAAPDLPERYRAHIERAGGSEIKLIFEKRLAKSDVDHNSARLRMQHGRILQDFLMETRSVWNGGEIDSILIDTQLTERAIKIGMWKSMGSAYVVKKTWNEVVRENDLEADDEVQLWSFRVGGELRLALVLLAKGHR